MLLSILCSSSGQLSICPPEGCFVHKLPTHGPLIDGFFRSPRPRCGGPVCGEYQRGRGDLPIASNPCHNAVMPTSANQAAQQAVTQSVAGGIHKAYAGRPDAAKSVAPNGNHGDNTQPSRWRQSVDLSQILSAQLDHISEITGQSKSAIVVAALLDALPDLVARADGIKKRHQELSQAKPVKR